MVDAQQSYFKKLTPEPRPTGYKLRPCEFDQPGLRAQHKGHKCMYLHRDDKMTEIGAGPFFTVHVLEFRNCSTTSMRVNGKWYLYDAHFIKLCGAASVEVGASSKEETPSKAVVVAAGAPSKNTAPRTWTVPPVPIHSTAATFPSLEETKTTVPVTVAAAVTSPLSDVFTGYQFHIPQPITPTTPFTFPSSDTVPSPKPTPKIPTAFPTYEPTVTVAATEDAPPDLFHRIFTAEFTAQRIKCLQQPNVALPYCQIVRIHDNPFKCYVGYASEELGKPSQSTATLRSSILVNSHGGPDCTRILHVTDPVDFSGYHVATWYDDDTLSSFEPLSPTMGAPFALVPGTLLVIVRLAVLLPWPDRWCIEIPCKNGKAVRLTSNVCRYLGLDSMAIASERLLKPKLEVEEGVWSRIAMSAYNYSVRFGMEHVDVIVAYGLSFGLLYKGMTDVYQSVTAENARVVHAWLSAASKNMPMVPGAKIDSMILRKCWALM